MNGYGNNRVCFNCRRLRTSGYSLVKKLRLFQVNSIQGGRTIKHSIFSLYKNTSIYIYVQPFLVMCYAARCPQSKMFKTGAPYHMVRVMLCGQKLVPENTSQGTQLGQSKPSLCLRKMNQGFYLQNLCYNKYENFS